MSDLIVTREPFPANLTLAEVLDCTRRSRQPVLQACQPWKGNDLSPLFSGGNLNDHLRLHKGYVAGFNADPRRTFDLYGAVLHDLFWASLVPGGTEMPKGPGGARHLRAFPKSLPDQIRHLMLGIRGSGWVLVGMKPGARKAEAWAIPNHNLNDVVRHAIEPFLVLDAWEHSWYPDYPPRGKQIGSLPGRTEYVDRLLATVNWAYAEARWRDLRG